MGAGNQQKEAIMDFSSAADGVEQIRLSRRETSRLRVLFTILVVSVVALFGWRIYGVFTSFDDAKFMASLDRQTVRKVWPMASSELDAVRTRVTPLLVEMFGRKMEGAAPKVLGAVEAEADRLRTSFDKKPEKILTEVLGKTRKEHHAVLAKAFPEIAKSSPERLEALTERVQNRLRQWSILQFTGALEQAVASLIRVKGTLEKLQPAKTEGARQANPEEVLELFLAIMNTRLDGEVAK